MDEKGLYGKYRVTKADGTPVDNCFILRPERDPAAVSALRAYATATENEQIREDLYRWVGKPMQKPLKLEELGQYEDKPVFVEVGFRRPNWDRPKITHKKWYLLRWFGKGAEQYRNYIDFVTTCIPDNDGCYHESFRRTEYGKSWRCWASKPTDEERKAAAWES